jgi:hypothetical protein
MSTEKAGMCWGFVREVPWGDKSTWKWSRRDDKAETSLHRLKSGCGANTYGTTKVAPSRIVNPRGISWGIFVEKCQECHKDSDCGEFAKLGARIRDNCIDCHMPVQGVEPDHSHLNGKEIKAGMRNHRIKPYSAPAN